MLHKIIETALLFAIGIILPVAGNLTVLQSWPAWVLMVYGVLASMTQPKIDPEKKKAGGHDRYSLIVILCGAVLTFAIPLADYAYGKPRNILFTQAATWVGLGLIWGGFALRLWAIHVLGKFFTAQVVIQNNHQLVQDGPYKILRHPSYTGAWISGVGMSVLFQSRVGLIFSIFVYFLVYVYRIECEEKALRGIFGDIYQQYSRRTSRLIPYIY